jgi:hypothetical protein
MGRHLLPSRRPAAASRKTPVQIVVDRRLLVGGDPSFQEIDPTIVAWLLRRVPGVRRYGCRLARRITVIAS